MFNQLQKNIRKYFGISRTEANGMIVMILLLVFLVILPLLYRQFGKGGYKNYQQDLALMDSVSDILQSSPEEILAEDTFQVNTFESFVFFNPNNVSFSQMLRMGFDSILAKRIISYRNKGGEFRQSRDLLKIYDFPSTLFHRISPYIRIPEEEKTIVNHIKRESTETDEKVSAQQEMFPFRMDLNQADSSQLILVRGIGPVFSKRIIKYRQLLGGYIKTEQLNEVYGLQEETLSHLKEVVYVDSLFEPQKIRINFTEWQDLIKHPYIQSDLANRILKVRSINGPYLDADDFIKRLGIDDSLGNRMVPYFEF